MSKKQPYDYSKRAVVKEDHHESETEDSRTELKELSAIVPVNVRAWPHMEAKIVLILGKGDEVLGKLDGDWYEVYTRDDEPVLIGYSMAAYLS